MKRKKILFIYNPISGVSGKRMILGQIDSRIDNNKYVCEVAKTTYAGHATALARHAAESGFDIVCAVGGDGTVNEVARALTGTDVALAIIPCGSGNGLARHLHVPLDPIRAVEFINEGTVRTMDYGVANGLPFFCTCGMGFDAFISAKFAKSKTRGLVSYIENVLTTALKYNPETYDIDVVNESEEHNVHKAFLIACCNSSQYGNNIYIAPQASVHDGLLDVTIIKPFTVMDVPQIALHMLGGTLEPSEHVSMFRCKSLTIRRQSSGVIHYDGDPVESGTEIEVSVRPGGLRCLCPAEEGVTDVAANIQNAIVGQFNMMQMRSEELIKANKKANRKLREQTKRTNDKLREKTLGLVRKLKR